MIAQYLPTGFSHFETPQLSWEVSEAAANTSAHLHHKFRFNKWKIVVPNRLEVHHFAFTKYFLILPL